MKLRFVFTLTIITFAANLFADSMTDSRNGKTYKTLKIGNQTWMAENLNFASKQSKCYDNEESNCDKYGRLYTWDDAMSACPDGWHLPSNGEFETLAEYVGNGRDYELESYLNEEIEIRGAHSTAKIWKDVGMKLKSRSGWNDYEGNSGNGLDEFGFEALSTGVYDYKDGKFLFKGITTHFWSSTNYSETSANCFILDHKFGGAIVFHFNKQNAYSVRCIKN